MKRNRKLFSDDGNILIISVVIVALLIATGFGYMSWATDERWDTAYEEATVQAYFLAQAGLIEKGLHFLRTRKPSELPAGTIHLAPGIVPDVGSYNNVRVMRVQSMGEGNIFQRSDTYDIYATGRAEFTNHQIGNRGYGAKLRVERTSKLRARLRSFSNYMYLTNYETTDYDEIIWFWSEDTLYGRTHSNDYIGLKYSPHFFGPISTCQDRFIYRDPQNIYFAYPPQFEVPPVLFPRHAESLRANASPRISSQNGRYMTRVWLRGNEGIIAYQYELGTEPPPLYGNVDDIVNPMRLRPPAWGAIFIEGQAEVYGQVSGALTIGSSSTMWLVDNIFYTGADYRNGRWSVNVYDTNMPNILGLVSEGDIIIKDNYWNGRENGFGIYSPQSLEHHSITINAALVALDQSFTFQHQNDDWEAYQGPTPDRRGIIHLKGSVTQWRRGYVHRSNHIATGYGKDYEYDFRFDERPPPYYLEAMDEDGHGLFDLISWNELRPGE
ncbi:MAG: hypothetical protein P9X24_08010 [Candidatus Hatepunaea meridiana]|nr:hypothetical protein [Candidatus Hatepunaea meridiana]